MKKDILYHDNTRQKKARAVILILHKVDFRENTFTRERESHFIIMKTPIHLKDVKNICVPYNRASKYMSKK